MPELAKVGPVPLGLHHRGRVHIRWNLELNGQELAKGRYEITRRGFDRHHDLIGTSSRRRLVLH